MKNIPKFEIKDRLKPIPNKQSNYYNLRELKEVEVLNNDVYPSYTKKLIHVKIIVGWAIGTHHNFVNKTIGETISVYEDAFEKIYDIPEDYSIF